MAKILGANARIVLVEGCGVVIATPGIGDDPVASLGEHGLLVTPDQRTAGRRMKKHDRHALAARVPVPETAVGNLRHAVLSRNWRGNGMGLIGLATIWLYAVSIRPIASTAKPVASPIQRKTPDRRAHLEKWFFFIVMPRSLPTPIFQKTQLPCETSGAAS